MINRTKQSNRRVILAYLLWLILALLLGYVAWNLHAALVTLMSIWVASPDYRPLGWTSESIQPFSRLSILVVGSAALIYGLWLEGRLQRAGKEGKLWRYTIKTGVGLLVALVICLLLINL